MTDPLEIALPAEFFQAVVEAVTERVLARLDERANREPRALSPYMTIPEAADYLRCSRQRVDDLLSQRRLMRVKDGGRTLIRREEIDAYLSRNGGGGR